MMGDRFHGSVASKQQQMCSSFFEQIIVFVFFYCKLIILVFLSAGTLFKSYFLMFATKHFKD